ncbi:MAG: short-chain dehydrogenase [Actinoallomurus sp.]|jgi:NAD(P)-dependent dehydrogenase (short-subunit alcohol dehydrogenase family)|nr:short-chain dehydrogenase [Actinoallomurus sp.]
MGELDGLTAVVTGTAPTTQAQWDGYGEEGQRALVERIAVRRIGTPEDIARGVEFFVAPRRRMGQRSDDLHRRRTFPLLMAGKKGRTP